MGESTRTTLASVFLCSLLTLALACSSDPSSGNKDGSGGGNPGGSGGSGGDGGTGGSGGSGGTGGSGGSNPNLPRIDALEPDHGVIGAQVTIRGVNFAKEAMNNRVYFGGIESSVLAGSTDGTSVKTSVPLGARSGTVVLLTNEIRVEGPSFTIDPDPPPVLNSIVPEKVPVRRDATIRLLGTGFRYQSKVLVDGVEATNKSFISGTELNLNFGGSSLATPGFRTIQVVNAPPGGGESEIKNLEVYETLSLDYVRAVDATTVRLTFDTAVNATQAANASVYTFSDGLASVAAAVNPENPAQVLVTTSQQTAFNRYTVTVNSNLRSATGGVLVRNQGQFFGFRLLPDASGTIGGAPGCGASGLSAPSGLTLHEDGYFIVERTGHQVQTVSRRSGELRGFFGHNGVGAGYFEDGNALNCPGETGSSLDGAFSGPMGVVVVREDGYRLVGDTGNDRVQLWGPDNSYRGVFGSGFVDPVLLGRFAEQVWVAGSDQLIRIVGADGVEISQFGGPGAGIGEFSFGIDEHVAPAAVEYGGAVVVTDPLNHRLQRFVDGEPAGWLGGGRQGWPDDTVVPPATCCAAGTGANHFTRPRGVVAWMDDLWVIDEAGGGRLIRFDSEGNYLAEKSLGFLPTFVAASPGGRLWILDEANNVVQMFW